MKILTADTLQRCEQYSHTDATGITCSLFQAPREFFARNADPRVLSPFHEVAAEGFGMPLDHKSLEGVKRHVSDDFLSLAHRGSELLGFASLICLPHEDTVHLHGIVMASEVQGLGIGLALANALLKQTTSAWLSFTTQNPCMFVLGRKLTRLIFPTPETPRIPSNIRPIGNAVFSKLCPNDTLDQSTFVSRGFYGSCLYQALPRSRDGAVNRWFDETLSAKDGTSTDAFLFLGVRT